MTSLSEWSQYIGHQTILEDGKVYLDFEKAAGAPAGSKYGYLPCGCRNDGNYNHVR